VVAGGTLPCCDGHGDLAVITWLVLRRVLQGALVFVGATFVVFCMVYLLPGDEIRALFGLRRPDPAQLEELRIAYDLERPFVVQWWLYLTGFLRGDMGPLYRLTTGGTIVPQDAVNLVVGGTLPLTLRILAVSAITQVAIAIPVGVALGRRGGHPAGDRAALLLSVAGVAIPGFVIAAALRPWLVRTFGVAFLEADGWTEALVPGLVAALVPAALIVRVLRQRAKAIALQPWVATMRGGGVKEGRIAWWFAARQVLVTGVTLVAAEIGPTLAALLVVEQVFEVRGLGSTLLAAVRAQQGPLVIGAVVTFVAITVVATMLADVVVLLLDPRTRRRG
jgi:oligopeptide transport system permease protein